MVIASPFLTDQHNRPAALDQEKEIILRMSNSGRWQTLYDKTKQQCIPVKAAGHDSKL